MASERRTGGAGESTLERLAGGLHSRWTGLLVNATPGGVWLLVFHLASLAVMFCYSFGERGAFGEVLLGTEHPGLQ